MSENDEALPFGDLWWSTSHQTAEYEASTPPRILQTRSRRLVPALPTAANRPRRATGPGSPTTDRRPPDASEDPDLHTVAAWLRARDGDGSRVATALRAALDQVYDGRKTGRWDYTQLSKTEKTHIGTLVEIWLQREFDFEDGVDLDFQIAGHDVDCKWSRDLYSWEIPLEMYSDGPKIALLLWANEDTARWALGLLRITDDVLKPMGKQRDRKRTLSMEGRDRILWVYREMPMIENTLVRHPEVAAKIATCRTGQKATDLLFRRLQRILINHATVETAAQQIDSSKRVRDARKKLRPEGIVIFGHYAPHPEMAAALGLPRPSLGRFVSARLAPWTVGDAEPYVTVEDGRWRLARPDDPPAAAPELPQQGRS